MSPDINQLKPSKVLRKEHLPEPPKGVRVLIDRVEIDAPLGFQGEKINVLHLRPHNFLPRLPVRLSGQMLDQLAYICGSRDYTTWGGKEIVIWHDPSVLSAGKPVGGIRARAPKGSPAANVAQVSAPAPAPTPAAPPDDEDFEVVAEEAEGFDEDDAPF